MRTFGRFESEWNFRLFVSTFNSVSAPKMALRSLLTKTDLEFARSARNSRRSSSLGIGEARVSWSHFQDQFGQVSLIQNAYKMSKENISLRFYNFGNF